MTEKVEEKTQENAQGKELSPKADAMDVIAMLLKENNDLRKEMIVLRSNGETNGTPKKKAAPRPAVRCMDTKTGIVYHSHASAGMAVAPEYNLKVHNFVWYELTKGTKNVPAKCPERFKDITEEKYQEVLKANEEKLEKLEKPPVTQPAVIKPLVNTNQGHRK